MHCSRPLYAIPLVKSAVAPLLFHIILRKVNMPLIVIQIKILQHIPNDIKPSEALLFSTLLSLFNTSTHFKTAPKHLINNYQDSCTALRARALWRH